MTDVDLVRQRLQNQRLSGSSLQTAGDVVQWLGAVQAQDYAAAKWAVAQRTAGLTDADLDQALADRAILRTHVMRPTWHLVAPEDIRWLLRLTAPRVHIANAYHYRHLELDNAIFKRSNTALTQALGNGAHLTRAELASVLRRAGIAAGELRLGYLLMHAELEGIVCSGARREKQFTYALLDHRVPATKILGREAALAELTRRYFASHGPATEEDFMWWSGLTRTDVRNGLDMAVRQLAHEVVAGKTYWFAASTPPVQHRSRAVYLLPNYDEYVVGYTDRSAIFDSAQANHLDARHNPLFQHTLVIKGRIAGTWKRTLKKNTVVVEVNPFALLTKAERQALVRAARWYGDFLQRPVALAEGRGRRA
jgi:uncharacterized protein YjbI with pentapeptide repeats